MGNDTGDQTGSNGGHTHEETTHGFEHTLHVAVVFFVFCSCGIGALLLHLGKRIHLPYTVLLLVIGIVFGFVSTTTQSIHEYAVISEVDPHLLLHIFLPVLIFESAFEMEAHTFFKSFFQVLLLAVPGLALASFLTCLMAMYLFHEYQWDWNVCMMFGCILSATDPVAVVALLRELGTSKQLAMLIEGESLLNDGAAIVLFTVFEKLITQSGSIAGGEIVTYFMQVALGGPAFGYLMARLTLFWLSRIFNDALSEITITLASTYITYYVGEVFLKVSGVLAVVVLGVFVSAGKANISPEVEVFLHRFWEVLAYLANTLIFILVGLVIQDKAIQPGEIEDMDLFYLVVLYFGINVIRFLVLGMLLPFLKQIGYGMSVKEMLVMTWSGVRGAVGLALGLLVTKNPNIDLHIKSKVLIHVSGIVVLTLLINGTTVKLLLKLLGMSDVSQPKRMAMASAVRHLQDRREKSLNILKTSRFLADADWDFVEKASSIEDPYKTTDKEASLAGSGDLKTEVCCPECHACLPPNPSVKELKEMRKEAILRLLKAERMSYRRQFVNGMLSREAVRKLKECAEVAMDKVGFIDIEDIQSSWKVPNWIIKIKRLLKKWTGKAPLPGYQGRILQLLSDMTESMVFMVAVCFLVVVDIVVVILEVYEVFLDGGLGAHKLQLRVTSICVLGLYMLEAILKIVVQRSSYITSRWNQFCVFILCVGLIDISLHVAFLGDHEVEPYRSVLLTCCLLRIIRLGRLIQPVLPLVLVYIKHKIHKQLNFGYDVGRGYLCGEEEVSKLINHIVDNKDIAAQLLEASKAGQLEVIKTMGLLGKQHPDVAMSVKSRQAIRSVLNTLRDSIRGLREDGILDETESYELESMVEMKMKKLLTAPPLMTPPPPERLLKNVSWLQGDETLIKFIRERAAMVNYNYGDMIIKRGDPTEGIYILICGMVRMESPVSREPEDQEDPALIAVEYMSAGNVIGEMGLLTRQDYQATIWCETSVQAFFISTDDMLEAFKEFKSSSPSLEYRLWKVCALRISVNVLLEQPAYYGVTKDKIKMHLVPAYLADVNNTTEVPIDSSMTDVILIYGDVRDFCSKEIYHGPHYIPWTATKLVFEPGEKPVILIVPGENQRKLNSKTNDPVGGNKQAKVPKPTNSRLCLQHASRTRLLLENNKKGLSLPTFRKRMRKSQPMDVEGGNRDTKQISCNSNCLDPVSANVARDQLRSRFSEIEQKDEHPLHTSLKSYSPVCCDSQGTTSMDDEKRPAVPCDSQGQIHAKSFHKGGSMPSVDTPSPHEMDRCESAPTAKSHQWQNTKTD